MIARDGLCAPARPLRARAHRPLAESLVSACFGQVGTPPTHRHSPWPSGGHTPPSSHDPHSLRRPPRHPPPDDHALRHPPHHAPAMIYRSAPSTHVLLSGGHGGPPRAGGPLCGAMESPVEGERACSAEILRLASLAQDDRGRVESRAVTPRWRTRRGRGSRRAGRRRGPIRPTSGPPASRSGAAPRRPPRRAPAPGERPRRTPRA